MLSGSAPYAEIIAESGKNELKYAMFSSPPFVVGGPAVSTDQDIDSESYVGQMVEVAFDEMYIPSNSFE